MVPKPTIVLAATLKRVLVSKSREKAKEKVRAVIRAFEDRPSIHNKYSLVSDYMKALVRVGKLDEKNFTRDLLKRGEISHFCCLCFHLIRNK
ncbi:ATP-dependent zinc metalloprotease FTSH 4, mitochondrial [Trifolium repens]|jgi:hypothetical protein|nr:ATP-dependent zinc metalloprotease FTSH 4, mitochondrial [Trifolium repens]